MVWRASTQPFQPQPTHGLISTIVTAHDNLLRLLQLRQGGLCQRASQAVVQVEVGDDIVLDDCREPVCISGNKAKDKLHVAPQADSHCFGQSVSTAANRLHGWQRAPANSVPLQLLHAGSGQQQKPPPYLKRLRNLPCLKQVTPALRRRA